MTTLKGGDTSVASRADPWLLHEPAEMKGPPFAAGVHPVMALRIMRRSVEQMLCPWEILQKRNGAPGRGRTCDTRLRRPVLYPLSYERVTRQ